MKHGFGIFLSVKIRVNPWLILQNLFDPLHDGSVELIHQLARFHVLGHLRRLGGDVITVLTWGFEYSSGSDSRRRLQR